MNSISETAIFLFSFLSTTVLILVISVIWTIITIWRSLLTIILRWKHGKDFFGLMGAFDGGWAIDQISNCIIELVTIQSTSQSLEDFTEEVKSRAFEKLFKDPTIFPKFSCIRKNFLGTFYLLRNGFYEDVVKVHKVNTQKSVINKDDLVQEMEGILKTGLPVDSKTFIQFIIFDKPISLETDKAESKEKNYAVLFRIHHTAGDGFALSRFINQYFAWGAVEDINFREILAKKMQAKKEKRNKIADFFKILCKVAEDLPEIIRISLSKTTKENLFCRKRLTGEKLIATYMEPQEKHVDMVKEIKNKFPGTSFSDILFTVLSASLSDYFEKNLEETEKTFITIYIPVPFNVKQSQEIILCNSFSNFAMNLPLVKCNFEERLKIIQSQSKRAKESTDVLFAYWLTKFLSFLPSPILKCIVEGFVDYSSVITVIPGTKENVQLFKGTAIKELFLTLPGAKMLAMAVAFSSFGNRFQLGVLIDKGLIPDRESVNQVLADVLTNIEKFHYECTRKNS